MFTQNKNTADRISNIENRIILGKHVEKSKNVYEILMVIISAFELILFIRGVLIFSMNSYRHYVYLFSYVFLFATSLGMLIYLLLSNISKDDYKVCNVVMRLYSFAIILWSLVISFMDMKDGDFPIVYMTVLVTLSSVVVLVPNFYILLCFSSMIFLFVGEAVGNFGYFTSTGEYINIFVFATMAVVINWRLYLSAVKEHRSSETLVASVLEERNRVTDISLQTIQSIINTVDAKDKYTREHSQRVAEYSSIIAKKMKWPEDQIKKIHEIALLHDIGKIGVPDSILNCTGRLSPEEYEQMKQHTVIGGEILHDLTVIPSVDLGAKYHHERFDGKGYPSGLSGKDIPIEARIIAVADSFDAMSSNRVYRKHLTREKILSELQNGRGTQFDPDIVDLFMEAAADILDKQKDEEHAEA